MSAEDPERVEHEFEDLLRLSSERPGAPLREEVRRAFLTGARADGRADEDRSRGGQAERMPRVMAPGTAQPPGSAEGRGFGEEADGFEPWLVARAPAETPAAQARNRARLAFLSAVAETAPLRRTRRSFRGLVLALAAAAILAVTFLLPKPERWKVRLAGPLRFAEREYGLGEENQLAVALEGSGTVETGSERARFTLGNSSLGSGLEVVLLAGSTLTFPTLPELDGVSAVDFSLARGEAYLSTSPSYPGNPILVRTDLADVELHGTTIGVLVDELGTCVCVADGTVRVTGPGVEGGEGAVGPRGILRLFRDPTMGAKTEVFPEHSGPGTEHTEGLEAFLRDR